MYTKKNGNSTVFHYCYTPERATSCNEILAFLGPVKIYKLLFLYDEHTKRWRRGSQKKRNRRDREREYFNVGGEIKAGAIVY